MYMKRILSLTILIAGILSAAAAQEPEKPVSWRVTAKMTSPTEGVVTLRPVCGEGWHIYGTEEVKNGPIPTSFSFEGSQGVEYLGGVRPSVAPARKYQEMFGTELTYWEGAVSFTRKFKVTDAAKAKIAGTVRYMGCDDTRCMPPQTHSFSVAPKPFKKK